MGISGREILVTLPGSWPQAVSLNLVSPNKPGGPGITLNKIGCFSEGEPTFCTVASKDIGAESLMWVYISQKTDISAILWLGTFGEHQK